MLVSCYAFSRAGFGHVRFGFRGARSYGHSRTNVFIDLAVWGTAMGYYFLKACIQKLKSPKSPKSPKQELIIDKNVEHHIDFLFLQNEIDMNATQLKLLFSDIYISLQQAWMKQDLSQANQVLSEQLIRDLNKPLNSLKQRQLVDCIRDIEFNQIKLIKLSKIKNFQVVRVQLSGFMIDERVSLGELGSVGKKAFYKKEFTDIMEFSYHRNNGWKAVYLKVR